MTQEIILPKLPAGCYYYLRDGGNQLYYKMTTKNPNGGPPIILKDSQVLLNDIIVNIS
tara:strand:+ start:1402 stop:1575 length:174 start_codon:yes stop_codon:yes gene_type:complete